MPSERAWSTDLSSTTSPLTISRPSLGFWKPEMILIRVDLPAPLSPSSPSTSPLPRRRSMLRSAVTGPKCLATPSTRSTSSDAAATAHPPHVDVDHHRAQDGDAQDEVEIVGVDALQRQAVAQDAQEQRAEQRADRRALA